MIFATFFMIFVSSTAATFSPFLNLPKELILDDEIFANITENFIMNNPIGNFARKDFVFGERQDGKIIKIQQITNLKFVRDFYK